MDSISKEVARQLKQNREILESSSVDSDYHRGAIAAYKKMLSIILNEQAKLHELLEDND